MRYVTFASIKSLKPDVCFTVHTSHTSGAPGDHVDTSVWALLPQMVSCECLGQACCAKPHVGPE